MTWCREVNLNCTIILQTPQSTWRDAVAPARLALSALPANQRRRLRDTLILCSHPPIRPPLSSQEPQEYWPRYCRGLLTIKVSGDAGTDRRFISALKYLSDPRCATAALYPNKRNCRDSISHFLYSLLIIQSHRKPVGFTEQAFTLVVSSF